MVSTFLRLLKHILYYRFSLLTIFLGHSAGCGITDEISQWMESIQNAAVDEEPTQPPSTTSKPKEQVKPATSSYKAKEQPNFFPRNEEEFINKYSKEANEGVHSRHRRAARRDENRNTCSLYIQTDPLIWRHIREGFPEVFITIID